MRRASLLLVVAICAVLAATASTADAATRAGCAEQPTARPFLRWLDPLVYTLAPGGTFEGEQGWSGGAVVTGNEPFKVSSPADSRSLALAPGAATASPYMCAGLEHPTLRFFARGPLLGLLKIEVVYRTLLGTTVTQPAGVVAGTGSWGPTPPFAYLGNILTSLQLDGSQPSVSFRITAVAGSWRIDDVYVDPLASKCC